MGNKKKFKKGDIYNNTIVAYPEYEFYVCNKKVYVNRESEKDGDFSNKINHVGQGYINLHEINVNRPADGLVYPFITKDGARTAFRTVTTSQFQDTAQFAFGDEIKGTYPLSASIGRVFVPQTETTNTDGLVTNNKKFLRALYNPIESSGYLSRFFDYDRINSVKANIIEVPSIFYGSQVRKKSVQLDYYYSGSLIGQLKDTKGNGELVETVGLQQGQTAGIVLYEYGICILTASYSISTEEDVKDMYLPGEGNSSPSWLTFGSGIPNEPVGQGVGHSPSYLIKLQGTNKIPTLTMLATAGKGELNFSNNPTFLAQEGAKEPEVSVSSYSEGASKIINITKSKYEGYQEEFQNTVYISKIGIYDEEGNLLGIASLANPIKKTEAQDILFKLRVDF